MEGSFVHLSPSDTKMEIGTEVSIAFVCGQMSREIDNPNSNVNKTLWKLRNHLVMENVVSLTLMLYDKTGAPLKQDRVVQRYIANNLKLNNESFENPCYRHGNQDDSFQNKHKVDKDLVVSECMEVARFLRRSKDIFTKIRKLRLVCFHYINIPKDLRFMFNVAKRLEVIEKVNENGDGPEFNLTETGLEQRDSSLRNSLGI